MKIVLLDDFRRDFAGLPRRIQLRTRRALALLEENPRHPSLRVKKMKGPSAIWEARVTRSYRLTFNWESDLITLRRVGSHDILRREA